jgi:hypothetical protein
VPETDTSADPLKLPSLLRPSIEAAIAESEIRGDIPATLHTALRDAGAFLLTPREFGGSETPLTDVLRGIRELRPHRRLGRVAGVERKLRLHGRPAQRVGRGPNLE